MLGARRFPDRRFVLDWDMTTQLVLDGDTLVGLPERGLRYRRHTDSATSQLTRNQQRFLEESDYYDRMLPIARARGWDRCVRLCQHRRILKLNVTLTSLISAVPAAGGGRPPGLPAAAGNGPRRRKLMVERPIAVTADHADNGKKRALITGITGQDGAYLAEFLLEEGLRGARRQAARLDVQHRPRRPPARGAEPAQPAVLPPPRRPHRLVQPDAHPAEGRTRRGLQPWCAKSRGGQLRGAGVHGQLRCPGRHAVAGGDPHPGPARDDPVLPGVDVRAVRAGARDAPARDHAVLPAQPLRRGEAVRLLDHRQLPGGVRPVRLQRHPVQPRVADPRGDLRHPEDHPRPGPHQAGPAGLPVPRQPECPARLGSRPRLRRGPVADVAAAAGRGLRHRHRRAAQRARVRRGGRPAAGDAHRLARPGRRRGRHATPTRRR